MSHTRPPWARDSLAAQGVGQRRAEGESHLGNIDGFEQPFEGHLGNEWYSKDANKKIRAGMKVKGNAGEHLTSCPMKLPDNPKQWIGGEEASQAVYEIGFM